MGGIQLGRTTYLLHGRSAWHQRGEARPAFPRIDPMCGSRLELAKEGLVLNTEGSREIEAMLLCRQLQVDVLVELGFKATPKCIIENCLHRRFLTHLSMTIQVPS